MGVHDCLFVYVSEFDTLHVHVCVHLSQLRGEGGNMPVHYLIDHAVIAILYMHAGCNLPGRYWRDP